MTDKLPIPTLITPDGRIFGYSKSYRVRKSRRLRTKEEVTNDLHKFVGVTLEDCYKRISPRKTEVYNKWKKWADENGVQYFGVKAYNSYLFTLHGLLPLDGKRFYFIVTFDRATLYPYD